LTRVANYELIKEVGRGGMGVVFKARDVRLNRIVALKMIRDKALANPDELQRFEKEAAAAAQLKHPNIVALHDFDRYNDQPFLSMEFIGGTSLAERVSMGPLSGRRAAEYLELTARAVHYAHTKGIIHRDLKPANVLLDEDDQPKVTDFGLAKQMEANSDQTRTGAVLGTPSYMSPEQATGSKAISPSSDIYSLGAILYELLTGKPPFAGETPLKTLNLVCEQDPIMPRLLNPSVDRELETICLKCLEKSPSRRYDSAESLADDLHRFLQGEPITARRVSIVGRGVKWCRRHQWETIVGSAIVVTIAAFIGFLLYDARVADNLRQEAVEAKNQSADRFSTMRSLFYLSQMRQAHQTLRRADLEGVERIIDHWAFNANQADLRDWEWYFLKEQCQHRLAFSTHQGRAFAVAYRPDGKQLATAGGELNKPGEIKVLEARTGKLLHTLQGHTNVVTAVAYHPTKNLLASASYDQTIKLWDLNTGTGIQTLRGHTSYVYHVAFSPKGDRLASASEDHTVRLWDWERYAREPAESAKKLAGQDGHDGPVTAVAFHPELDLLASASRDRTVKLWSVSTGQLEKTWSEHVGPVETLAFTPNGKTLVSGGGRGSQRGEVLFSDVDTGKVRDARYGLSDRVQHLAISPDGKVAAGCGDGVVRVWNKGLSSEALSFRADPLSVSGVAFAPDGFTLASAGRSGRISLWNSSAGLETLTLPALGAMETVAFNPKGRYLAAAGGPRGDVRVWNLDSPDHPIVDKGHKGAVFALAFSPDGQTLASGGEDRVVRLVDFLHPDNAPTLLPGHKARIHAMAYRPDGMMLASADDDDAILLHDLAAGKPPTILLGQTKGVLCLAFSPDGQYLASGGFDKTIRLWDLKTGKNYALESHGNSINALAFNHDGSVLASASNDKTIRVWDVAKRKEEFKLEGTPGPVQSLAFHPGGRRLVSIGQDRMIRLWDFVTRQEILEFEEHLGTLRSVAFSADGRSLAGAGNGVVRVWQASKEMPSERR
jgi:WD40 repeat protein/tRNA A-37 threonylcarbamoyl transferase component Bud32